MINEKCNIFTDHNLTVVLLFEKGAYHERLHMFCIVSLKLAFFSTMRLFCIVPLRLAFFSTVCVFCIVPLKLAFFSTVCVCGSCRKKSSVPIWLRKKLSCLLQTERFDSSLTVERKLWFHAYCRKKGLIPVWLLKKGLIPLWCSHGVDDSLMNCSGASLYSAGNRRQSPVTTSRVL